MKNIKKLSENLNEMVTKGELIDAFEKYYDDEVEVQENNSEPRVGKEVNREYQQNLVSGLMEFRGATVLNTAIGDDISITEWHLDFDHRDFGKVDRKEVSIQKWRDGKVVNEHFYYDTKET